MRSGKSSQVAYRAAGGNARLGHTAGGGDEGHEEVVHDLEDPLLGDGLVGHQHVVAHQVEWHGQDDRGDAVEVDLAALVCAAVDLRGPQRAVGDELFPYWAGVRPLLASRPENAALTTVAKLTRTLLFPRKRRGIRPGPGPRQLRLQARPKRDIDLNETKRPLGALGGTRTSNLRIRRNIRAGSRPAHRAMTCWNANQRCAGICGVERRCEAKMRPEGPG